MGSLLLGENPKMKIEKMKSIKPKHKNQIRKNEKGETKMSKTLKPLRVGKLALHEYRMNSNGNYELTKDEVARKLTRNTLLAYPIPTEDNDYKWYAYGGMRILVKKNKKIISVINRQPTIVGHGIDEQKKVKLNKLLKIT